MDQAKEDARRTAGEAGWHASRYNLMAKVPGSDNVAIANLFKGTCAEYNLIEVYLLSMIEQLSERHPVIDRFAKRGLVCNFDERAALETFARAACAHARRVELAICPTMGCNFDCPYCFENHGRGKMARDVQDDVVALAERMANACGADDLAVTWFGGEPLLALDVVESLSKRLMTLADGRGGTYTASIITNGYLLTQDTVDLLARCKVASAQVTVDGLGATHDATRRLAGGGPTFNRIVAHLHDCAIPFKVAVRHNVHGANMREMDELRTFVERIAEESGNDLVYYPYPVVDSEAARRREGQVGLICASDASEVGIRRMARDFRSGRGVFCGAQSIWNIGIDDRGNLQKCWEALGRPELSFGTARDWDPASPLATASAPDNLTRYLNSALPVLDEECRECVWLPHCAGGCPHRRLSGGRQCVAYKDDAEAYVLALHARIGEANER